MIDLSENARVTNGAMAHKLIAETAKSMARESYEKFASNNDFYKTFPNGSTFAAKEYGRFIKEARHILATMLGRKDISNEIKEIIMEALALDRSLPTGRISGVIKSLKHATRLNH